VTFAKDESDMRNTLPNLLWVGLVGFLPASPALSGSTECVARSPEHTVALLELFTSEGCSSCPPADRWLSGLRTGGKVAGKVVPLSLHVDYWDYIGWQDAFAQARFAARQRELAMHAGNAVVYTPQFFVQGKPYRPPPSTTAFNAELDAIYTRAPRADIALSLGQVASGKLPFKVTARLRDGQASWPAGLFVVLYENGLTSKVKAGENRGATLHHDFVVREWIGPKPLPATGSAEETMTFSLAPDRPAGNFGVAAFIQNPRTQEVLQALSRPVCG